MSDLPPKREGDAASLENIESLPEGVGQAIEARFEQMALERYSSQFPHPEHLERYAALYPDAARLVFENFDEQSKHRRQMEKIFVEGNERRAGRGQFLAYSLVVFAIGVGLVAVLNGNAVTGGIIIGGAFTGGLVLFVAGGGRSPGPARTQRNERDSARASSGQTQGRTHPED